jgi:glycosyltransferase involved in cell wall biosynthesis
MTPLDKTNTLVIVPAYNEQDSINSVIEEIKATGFPFVVIDDGSTDETRKRAISAGARIISLPFNAGVGGALKCGFRYAIEKEYQAVIQCDADGQHPSEQLERFIDYANCNADHLVIGSRFAGTSGSIDLSRHRRLLMRLLSKTVGCEEVSDTTSGFRLTRKPLLDEFARAFPNHYLGDTYEVLVVALKNKYSVGEIPTPMTNRRFGQSSASNVYAVSNVIRVVLARILRIQFQIRPSSQT